MVDNLIRSTFTLPDNASIGGTGKDVGWREPPMNDLYTRVGCLEADVAVIKQTMATKEDIANVNTELHKSIGAQTWKMITAMGVFAAFFSAINGALIYFIK
ncbi:hypothetical protein [Carnimonas bestiolae]|uniref:hypothetical protein n=1 Tax=Carnimonas bestiolae TaxID=3402172 RepID=UPI003F4A9C61